MGGGWFPLDFGGLGGFGVEDRAEELADAILDGLGEGVYSTDRDSDHGKLRYALAVALAMGEAVDAEVWVNALADDAVALITEWEQTLGLGAAPGYWTLVERAARVAAECARTRGNNPTTLAVVFTTLTGSTCYVSETDQAAVRWPYNRFNVAVVLPQAAWDDNDLWTECEIIREKLVHAHGTLNLCVTHDGVSPNRRPVFYSYDPTKSAHSLTERDCTYPD